MTPAYRPPFKPATPELQVTGIVIEEPLYGEVPVGHFDSFASNESHRTVHVDNLRVEGQEQGESVDFEMFPDELKTTKPWGIHAVGVLSIHGEDKYREMFLQRPSKLERVKEMLGGSQGGKTKVKFLPSVRELKR
jgi:hypothetical protein